MHEEQVSEREQTETLVFAHALCGGFPSIPTETSAGGIVEDDDVDAASGASRRAADGLAAVGRAAAVLCVAVDAAVRKELAGAAAARAHTSKHALSAHREK